jgi:CheY-like chemotaxis protein
MELLLPIVRQAFHLTAEHRVSMPLDGENDTERINQEFGPILQRALQRVRELLPDEFVLLCEAPAMPLRVRCIPGQLEDVIASACLVTWQSMAGLDPRIVVSVNEVVMDNIVLDDHAEQLQGGLPPRSYIYITIGNNLRNPAGPLHLAVEPPPPGTPRHSAARLRLQQMHQVVVQHKGTFSVATDRTLGTGFDIYLPSALPLDRPALSGSGSTLKHVVYVDDYRGMRELVNEILPDAGFRVTCFDNGIAALRFIQTHLHECDAVVSDYKLPDINGIDLLAHLKELAPELPVVLMSGYLDDTLRQRAFAIGAAQVLSKSGEVEELCLALRELLDDEPQSQPGSFTDWASLR